MALGNLWEFEWEMMARYDFDEFGPHGLWGKDIPSEWGKFTIDDFLPDRAQLNLPHSSIQPFFLFLTSFISSIHSSYIGGIYKSEKRKKIIKICFSSE